VPEGAGDDEVESGEDEQDLEHDQADAARRGEQPQTGDRPGKPDRDAGRAFRGV